MKRLRMMLANMSAPRSLLLWLVILTCYRLWIIPRLGITLYIDEAQYWTWAQNLDWGYFSKPPLIAALIAASTALFGNGILAVKLSSVLLYPATAWIMFRLAEKLYDMRIGWRVGVATSLLPIVSALGLFVSTDAPLLFCWAGAMLSLLWAIENDRWQDWLLLGLLCGAGLMAKYTMGAFAASALLYLLIDTQRRQLLRRPGPWLAVALAAALLLPNIVWNMQHDFPTLRHTADITHIDGANTKSGNPGEFLEAQLGSLGLFAIAFVLALIAAVRRWRTLATERATPFLLAFSLPLLGLVFVQATRSEANGNWAAPALLAATILATAWLSGLRRQMWWRLALGVNLLLMLGVYHLQDVMRLAQQPMTAKHDFLKRARGWDQLAHAVQPFVLQYPDAIFLADNRTLMAHNLYELRDVLRDVAAWAPHTYPQDHYQLSMPLGSQHLGRRALLLTQDDYSSIAARFTRSTLIAKIRIHVEPGLAREASLVLLEDFQGYAPQNTQGR